MAMLKFTIDHQNSGHYGQNGHFDPFGSCPRRDQLGHKGIQLKSMKKLAQ